ncbi:hypothetical protein HPB49_015080 [Dermacentor silvarum]|uniref:Uncharacterized protein n=1 Tax=Dermacentor silvarum TaxID=543639 RepID=A0ACB8DJK1_DERSI|nr:hypothetical protein HPB49_015080 [Dermacentor silvarum]
MSRSTSGINRRLRTSREHVIASIVNRVGQRQLVCLARALLRCPRVLLLDEATSRMDGDTDRIVQRTIQEGFAACTVITVAHRLHTVLACDRILVMRDGGVAEFGTVAELAANPSSVFREMALTAGIDLTTMLNVSYEKLPQR